jgi:hypothetical protein
MPVLEEVSINISCGNMQCANGLMLSHDIWKDIPHLSRVALLSPVFDYALTPVQWSQWYGTEDESPPHLSEFFHNRQVLSTWTLSGGWVINRDLEAERLEEQFRINLWLDGKGEFPCRNPTLCMEN